MVGVGVSTWIRVRPLRARGLGRFRPRLPPEGVQASSESDSDSGEEGGGDLSDRAWLAGGAETEEGPWDSSRISELGASRGMLGRRVMLGWPRPS